MFKYRTHLSTFLCFANFIFHVATGGSLEKECPGMNRECVLNYYADLPLARRYPVKVGHITKLSFESEKTCEMKTVSTKPPIFEIPNYLSAEECDDIIKLAQEQGLETSQTMDEGMFDDVNILQEDQTDILDYYDYNKDNFLDVDEFVNLLDTELDFSPDREDVIQMFKTTGLDKNGDLKIRLDEFHKKDAEKIIKYVSRTKSNKPYTKSRYSNQTWLETDRNSVNTLHILRHRLHKLTQLPMVLLNASESLQVVSYGPRGHYNCHLDSDDIDEKTKCCHVDEYESSDCRICRYLTVLYFLSDVEEGGETAFPIADNETYDEEVWHKDLKRVCNVGRNCHKSNLRVKPEKGKAILWYSHEINSITGWMGSSDPYSVHGGCDVKKGRKWIANNWISVSENRTADIEFWIRNLQNTDDDAQERLKTKSSSEDKSGAFDDIFQAVESENTRKEEDVNAIFDILELSDMKNMETREEL